MCCRSAHKHHGNLRAARKSHGGRLYGSTLDKGVRVAAGRYAGDRLVDIATSPGYHYPQTQKYVKRFDGASLPLFVQLGPDVLDYPGWTGGVFVAGNADF